MSFFWPRMRIASRQLGIPRILCGHYCHSIATYTKLELQLPTRPLPRSKTLIGFHQVCACLFLPGVHPEPSCGYIIYSPSEIIPNPPSKWFTLAVATSPVLATFKHDSFSCRMTGVIHSYFDSAFVYRYLTDELFYKLLFLCFSLMFGHFVLIQTAQVYLSYKSGYVFET